MPSTYAERLGRLRDMLIIRVGELQAVREARAEIERRYLDGHAALFLTLAAAWDEQVQRTGSLAAVACRLAELDGVRPAAPIDEDAVAARAGEYVADLVEPAKASALDKLGEGERAAGVAIGWLQRRLLVDSVSDGRSWRQLHDARLPHRRAPPGQHDREVPVSTHRGLAAPTR